MKRVHLFTLIFFNIEMLQVAITEKYDAQKIAMHLYNEEEMLKTS